MTSIDATTPQPIVIWEKLPKDYILADEPVDSLLQPLLAFALNEALDLAGLLTPAILVAIDMALCTKVDGKTVVKAPDWFYVPHAYPTLAGEIRRSYTPHAEGEIPAVVMEFLSDTDSGEYSQRPFYPYGKLWFYEQILQVPFYVIFDPSQPLLEVRHRQGDRYQLLTPDREGRYFITPLNLYLGTWYGKRQEISAHWLRWWDNQGNLLLWASERIAREQQKIERLGQRLRDMGIDPDETP